MADDPCHNIRLYSQMWCFNCVGIGSGMANLNRERMAMEAIRVLVQGGSGQKELGIMSFTRVKLVTGNGP